MKQKVASLENARKRASVQKRDEIAKIQKELISSENKRKDLEKQSERDQKEREQVIHSLILSVIIALHCILCTENKENRLSEQGIQSAHSLVFSIKTSSFDIIENR